MSKLMIATFAVAGIVALSGCMSLEERLASSDPRVKNEAEHELIESSRENSDETARIAAVKRISNKDYLYEIAVKANKAEKNSKGGTVNTVKEGLAAVDMLSGEDKMLQLALDAKSDEIRAAAFNKITSDDSFLRLAEKAADAAIRRRAFDKVANEDGFAHIVKWALLQIVDTSLPGVAATRPNTALALWGRARPAGHPAARIAA